MITGVMKAVESILDDKELQMIRLKALQHLTKASNAVQLGTGVYLGNANHADVNAVIDTFKPLDTIGGQPINREPPVTAKDLLVDDEEKEIFLAKRDELYARFLLMTDDEIFKVMKEPQGTLLIRSVAKKAGIYGYREAEINAPFLDVIRQNIASAIHLASTIHSVENESSVGEGDADDDTDTDNPMSLPAGLQNLMGTNAGNAGKD